MKRRLRALLLVAVLLIALLPQQTQKAEAAEFWATIPSGNYYLRNVATGKYLDVCGGGDYNTCDVINYQFNGSAAQVWSITGSKNYYKVKPKCTASRVLNQYGDYVVPGHNVNLWDDVNDATQRWKFKCIGGNRVVIYCAAGSNCVLDVNEYGSVCVSTYAGRASQQWYLTQTEVSIPSGSYYLASFPNGQYLDVQSGGDYNTCNVGIYGFNGSNAQTWVIDGSNTWYRIKPKCTVSRVLNQYGDYVVPGHNVNLWDDVYDSTQRWIFELVPNAYGNMNVYVVHCAADPSCVLDVDQYGNVFINTYGGQFDESQLWVLQAAN